MINQDRRQLSFEDIPAPAHLTERSREIWRQLVPSRIRSVGRLAMFQTALEALDRADEARGILEREGLVKTTERSGMPHAHPATKLERDARAQFAKLWTALGLEWDSRIDGRLDD